MTTIAPHGLAPNDNAFLNDIWAQPGALREVLRDLTSTQRSLLIQAAGLIRSAERVVLTSMGSAFHSLAPMACALAEVHPSVHLIETSELLRDVPRPSDLHIVMSRSGESREIRVLALALRDAGAPLLAITMTPGSTLARAASLTIHDRAPLDAFICTKAYTTMALAGLLLAGEVAGAIDPALVATLDEAIDLAEARLPEMLDRVTAVPWLGAGVTFLSWGAGRASASAASLWFEEAARIQASTSTVEAFFHGPVEIVDEGFHGIWIELEPEGGMLERRAVIEQHGGHLLGVSVQPRGGDDIEVPGANLPRHFRTLLAAIPLQLFAYATGCARGLTPGTMRYLGWVID